VNTGDASVAVQRAAIRRREGGVETSGEPAFRPRHAVAFVVLIVLTCALGSGALGSGWFEIDDARYVPENPLLARLSLANLGRMLSEPYFGNYSPAHLLSYALDRALGGLDPFVFHLSSALWGGVCAGWVYALTFRLSRSTRAAWVAGLLFALHPAHVEAIAWISSRKDLVATAFAIPAVIAYLDYRSVSGTWRSYVLALVLFTIATAGKLSVVVLPGVLFAYDLLVERRGLIASALDKLPYAAIVVFFGLRAADAQPVTNVDVSLADAAQIGGWMLWLSAGLGDFVIFRPVPDPAVSAGTLAGWSALLVVLVAGPWLFVRRALAGDGRIGLVLVLHAWLVLALLPSQVLGFLYPVSDRYLFFPSVPLVLLLGLAFERASRHHAATVRLAAVGVLLVLGGVWGWKSWSGARAWGDPRSVFYSQAHAVSDINAHKYLGWHYLRAVDALMEASGGDRLPEGHAALARSLGIDEAVLEREWQGQVPHRPATEALRAALMDRAWREHERAAEIPTPRAIPSLYYQRGRLQNLRGNTREALSEFQRSEREAAIYPIVDVAQAFTVQSLYSQALMAEKLDDLSVALDRMRAARAAQPGFLDVDAQVRRLERRVEEGGR